MPTVFEEVSHILRTNSGIASESVRHLVASASVNHRQQGKQQSKNSQTKPDVVPTQSRSSRNAHPKDLGTTIEQGATDQRKRATRPVPYLLPNCIRRKVLY
ncbi:hypothetical protein [Sphingobacterium detergens]